MGETVWQWLVANQLEVIGWLTGVLCVYLNWKENVWGWPIGLISVGLYIVFFYRTRFYADALLNAFFFVSGLYGWYQWLFGGRTNASSENFEARRKNQKAAVTAPRAIVRITLAEGIRTGLITFSSFLVFYLLLRQTDAAMPFWDSFLSAFSLGAQYLLARKILENWLVWIFVDFLYVPVFLYRHIYLTAALYFILFIMAILAYFEWRRSLLQPGTLR